MSNKLDIYTINLNKRVGTFKDCMSKKCRLTEGKPFDSKIFNSFYKMFLNMFGKEVYCIKDKKIGITILREGKQKKKEIMTAYSNHYIIEGLISGGPYDTIRRLIKLSDTSKRKLINRNQVVSDTYYMYLYLPLDKRIGILMIQSKENSSIRRIVKPFFEGLFKIDGKKSCRLNPFFPNWLIEEFLNGANLHSISFEAENVSSVLSNEDTVVNTETYDIKITLVPKGQTTAVNDSKNLIEWIISNGALKLGNAIKSLSSFSKIKGVMKNEEQKKSLPFVIDEEDNIHPVIKLDDYLKADDNGEFEREDLKKFCDGLLDKIKLEIYATERL